MRHLPATIAALAMTFGLAGTANALPITPAVYKTAPIASSDAGIVSVDFKRGFGKFGHRGFGHRGINRGFGRGFGRRGFGGTGFHPGFKRRSFSYGAGSGFFSFGSDSEAFGSGFRKNRSNRNLNPVFRGQDPSFGR